MRRVVDVARFKGQSMTNKQRATNAAAALAKNYTDDREGLTDILADLMHYADRAGYDFAEALRLAKAHHQTEKGKA
jgi:hypothetical protein